MSKGKQLYSLFIQNKNFKTTHFNSRLKVVALMAILFACLLNAAKLKKMSKKKKSNHYKGNMDEPAYCYSGCKPWDSCHMIRLFAWFYCVNVMKSQDPEKTTELSQVTYKLHHIMLYLAFELTTSVVIDTDCIGSCKSSYHTITATTGPIVICKRLLL